MGMPYSVSCDSRCCSSASTRNGERPLRSEASSYFCMPSNSPMTWLPSRRVQRKSTRNDRSPSMGWGRATCSRGSAKPCSIIAARASDSPPLSLCASAQYIVLMACRVPACPLLIRRNWETKELGLLPVRRSALSATASACPKRAVLMQSNVVRGSDVTRSPCRKTNSSRSTTCHRMVPVLEVRFALLVATWTSPNLSNGTDRPNATAADSWQNVQSGCRACSERIR